MAHAHEMNERALAGLESLGILLDRDVTRHVPDNGLRVFLVGWGFLAESYRQATAVVVLHRRELGHHASPNVRLLIEAVAQLWRLAEDGDAAVDSLNNAFRFKHGKLSTAVDPSVFGPTAETVAEMDAARAKVASATVPAQPGDVYTNVAQLLDRMDPTGGSKAIWLATTQLAHPTITLARCFFTDGPGEPVRLYTTPHYEGKLDITEFLPFQVFNLVFLATGAFDKIMAGSPWGSELARIGHEAGLPQSS
ncbi:hypothetical protein [Embleya hyalina]|uniref:Uncharacterized protein n=1 Tax=Embleya hyalina TaxID=516124 RepID=A0A401YYU8_9ACTN|nr:hypothetical protein [Embleya hyalina]GCD99763.1 hypothetical protein EHYA_07485 [Embleya hyalina]